MVIHFQNINYMGYDIFVTYRRTCPLLKMPDILMKVGSAPGFITDGVIIVFII